MKQPPPEQSPLKQSVFQQEKNGSFSLIIISLTAGLVIALFDVVVEISFASLIFSGPLSPYISNGIGFTLFGAFVFALVVALTSSYPGSVALPQDAPIAILGIMAVAITENMAQTSQPETIFFTVVAAIMLTSLLTGLFFLVLGTCQLGSLVRFVPYPVVGGFLAGTGWLLTKGSLSVMTDEPLSLYRLSIFIQTPVLLKWFPGVIFAVLLLLILRRYSHCLIMPGLILGGIGLFYVILFLTNTSLAEAGSQGWLLGPFPKGGLWQPLTFSTLQQVRWTTIFGQAGNIGTILLISVISLLLNASGLELAVRRDIDLNRELRSAGLANIFSGLGGGPVGFHSLSFSTLSQKLGAPNRLTGIFFAMICGIVLLFGSSILSFFPKTILGGLLLFLGLSFLVEWVYDAWFTLPRTDYILVLLILAAIGFLGFLEGVVFGIVIAVVLFVVKYSRINVVRHSLSGSSYHSNVDRSVPCQRILHEQGEQLLILKLQGYLFFGTAHNLLEQVRQRVMSSDLPPLQFVVIDFRQVSGLDSSGLHSFSKMKLLADSKSLTLVLTSLTPRMQQQFVRGRFFQEDSSVCLQFTDLDRGLEWCEERILEIDDMTLTEANDFYQERSGEDFLESVFAETLQSLEHQEMFESLTTDMMPYFERQEIQKDDYLIRQGAPPEALYLIESGQVSVFFEAGKAEKKRVRTLMAGTIVGEVGMYLQKPSTASVVVEEPGVVYRLSEDALQQMKSEKPQLASLFHEFMARLLCERLDKTNTTLQALLTD